MSAFVKFKTKAKEQTVCGLDIGTSAVKFVTIRFSKEKAELVDFGIEQVPPGQAAQPSQAPQALAALGRSRPIPEANISVSGDAAIIRYAAIPSMSREELRQALRFEAQKYIPFSVDEVHLDAHILKQGLPENKMLIIVAAVKKDFLSQRLALLKEANIRAAAVDMDSLALINAFHFNYAADDGVKDKTIALLNIGATLSNLSILEEGMPRLSRDIRLGGNNLTQHIASALSLDLKAAEELKQSAEPQEQAHVRSSAESVFGLLAKEIRTSFDYYESQSASSVTKIFLSGGSSVCRGAKEALSGLLGIEVGYWDLLKKIDISSSLDAQRIEKLVNAESALAREKVPDGAIISNQLAVAFGLALRQT